MFRAVIVFFALLSATVSAEEPTDLDAIWSNWVQGRGHEFHVVLRQEISAVCLARAEELVIEGNLSHYDGMGQGPAEQMFQVNGALGEWGEVLGAGPNLERIFRAWLLSPSHLAILEDSRWTQWGWGMARSGSTQVIVARFWRP